MRCRTPTERFGALAFSWGNAMMKKRTIVYIDGFNLYYGLLRFTSYKWLDIVAFAKSLLSGWCFSQSGRLPETFPKSNIKPHPSNHEWDASEGKTR